MFDSLIFDVDGTIWDTTITVAPAWNEALVECGLSAYANLTPDMLKNLFGKPMNIIIQSILPDQSSDIQKKYEQICYKKEDAAITASGGRLYPHMVETIKTLSQKYPLFIVSNCQSGYIQLMLEKTGLKPYFKDFACYGDAGLSKAQNIKLIIERNNLTNPVYIGDTQTDADSSFQAGIPFIHAEYGFGTVKSAFCSIKDISELLAI